MLYTFPPTDFRNYSPTKSTNWESDGVAAICGIFWYILQLNFEHVTYDVVIMVKISTNYLQSNELMHVALQQKVGFLKLNK